jgi:hypothetical protein
VRQIVFVDKIIVFAETANIRMFWHVFKLSSRGNISTDMQPQYGQVLVFGLRCQ